MHRSIVILLLIIALFSTVSALDNNLSPQQMQTADSIMEKYHIEYCCSTTANKCIVEKPKCTIAPRLYDFATWLVGINATPEDVIKQLNSRYEGFTSTKITAIDTAHLQPAGKPTSPVVIIAYVSANCPTCKREIGDLYNEVIFGKLWGKARLIAKPYGGGIGNKALYAAAAEGTFWKLFMALRKKKGTIKEEKDLIHFADSIGIATEQFKKRLKDPETEKLRAAGKEEGKRNGITYIPEFYINGKKYSSSKFAYWITDAALFEYGKQQ